MGIVWGGADACDGALLYVCSNVGVEALWNTEKGRYGGRFLWRWYLCVLSKKLVEKLGCLAVIIHHLYASVICLLIWQDEDQQRNWSAVT